jgi:hypothetical protein
VSPECELATPRQRPSAPRSQGGRMLAADGCASSSSNPACCFCGVRASGGPREWRSPCSGSLTGLGMLIWCRIAGVACPSTYAQLCITFHDSARALTSRRQLLRKVLIWPHGARSMLLCLSRGSGVNSNLSGDGWRGWLFLCSGRGCWVADKTGMGRSGWRASSYEVTPSRAGDARGRPADR